MPKITRREFLKTSAGFAAATVVTGLYSCTVPEPEEKVCTFCDYRPGETLGKVTVVTPEDGYYLHTFFDVTPFSPSQRYLAVTQFPYQGKKPQLGDIAKVCVVDLENQTIRTVYSTKAWSYQLGANVQWGNTSDRYLYSNDMIGGKAVGVRIDLETNEVLAYSGPKYDLAPDETFFIGGSLEFMNVAQYGYGIPDEPGEGPNFMQPDDKFREGIWKTDLETNKISLIMSLASLAEHVSDPAYYEGGTFYPFHTKINSSRTRVMQVLRCRFPDGKGGGNSSLFTFNEDGKDIIEVMDREIWSQKGKNTGGANHPNWHPNGEYIVMNVVPKFLGYENMRFCMFRFDGSDFRVLSDNHLGSGHPSVDNKTKYLITDAYPNQDWVVSDDGEIPIRLIDLSLDEEHEICSVSVDLGTSRYSRFAHINGGSHFKLDPHPAWSRDYQKVCFNGVINGIRRVFIADLSNVI